MKAAANAHSKSKKTEENAMVIIGRNNVKTKFVLILKKLRSTNKLWEVSSGSFS